MRHKRKADAFTLVELLVVVTIIGIMLGLTMPSFNTMMKSQQAASAKTLIRTALAQAQIYASSNQKYAGLRFQPDADGRPNIILIEHAPRCLVTDLSGVITEDNVAERFTAIPNAKPVALPEGIGVISLEVLTPPIVGNPGFQENSNQYLDNFTDNRSCLLGASTFTIIFSPTGQLIIKSVVVRERQLTDTFGNLVDLTFGSYARFHTPLAIPKPRFYQDNYKFKFGTNIWPWFNDSIKWCDREDSTYGMYIYEEEPMLAANKDLRYTEYISLLKPILINTYTGKLIEWDNF